jgi:predicted P-loop ATPase
VKNPSISVPPRTLASPDPPDVADIPGPGERQPAASPLADALTALFSLSVLTATKGNASKRLVPDAHGRPSKDPAHTLGIRAGRVEHVTLAGLAGLAALLARIGPKQALVHGIPKGSTPGEVFQLVLAERYTGAPGTCARTLDCITYPDGLRLLLFDYDPDPLAPTPLASAQELTAHLATLWSAFADVGWLATTSTSSAIRDKKSKDWLRPPDGMHVYVLVTGDMARFRDILKVRLWLAGSGFCKLATPNTQTGVAAVLERAMVDLTVLSPERLDYVAGAQIPKDAPFYQDRPAPEIHPGQVLDLDRLPEVTEAERQEYARLVADARARVAPEQRTRVRTHITTATPSLSAAEVEAEVSTRIARAARGELEAGHALYFDNGQQVTAGMLRKALDGQRLADPQEPTYGKSQAVLHWRQGDWRIVSWAHGVKRVYQAATSSADAPPGPDEADWQATFAHAQPGSQNGTQAPPDTWQQRLTRTGSGEPKETFANLVLALQHTAPWATQCWYDLVRELPMCGQEALSDDLVGRAALALERRVGLPIRNLRLVQAALVQHCRATPRDVLKEYLETLVGKWDGTPRLDTWFINSCGAEDTPYSRSIGRLILLGMVARAENPGCQFRSVPVLEGPEDLGKSKLVETLASPEWYRVLSNSLEGKESHMLLQGVWVAELDELASLRRTEEPRLKSFITMKKDDYVPKFANAPVSRLRRTIFIGTVNPDGESTYFSGQTGNTRFLPIPITTADIAAVQRDREQLLAEALVVYRQHPDDWWQLSADGQAQAADAREARRQRSVYEDVLKDWLVHEDFPIVDNHRLTTFEAIAKQVLKLDIKDWKDRAVQMEVAKSMRAAGWESHPMRLDLQTRRALGHADHADRVLMVRVWRRSVALEPVDGMIEEDDKPGCNNL